MTREPWAKRGSRCWCLGGSQTGFFLPLSLFSSGYFLWAVTLEMRREQGSPTLQCWGFVREYIYPDWWFWSQDPLVGAQAASQLAFSAHGHHTAGGPRLARTSIQSAHYACSRTLFVLGAGLDSWLEH